LCDFWGSTNWSELTEQGVELSGRNNCMLRGLSPDAMPRTPQKSHKTITLRQPWRYQQRLIVAVGILSQNLKELIHATPQKGKRCNNPQSPFLWLCSARLCLLQFFIFFRWQLLNKQKHNQVTTVSSAIQRIRNKACRRKETTRHEDAPGCRARAPFRSSASFPGNDSGIPIFPCRSLCSTTDLTRRCAADSAAPSGSASSPCGTGWTRCLRKKRKHWWQYCVGANDAFGNLGRKK